MNTQFGVDADNTTIVVKYDIHMIAESDWVIYMDSSLLKCSKIVTEELPPK